MPQAVLSRATSSHVLEPDSISHCRAVSQLILSWASRFDDASYEAKHLVIAQLVDRIEIRKNDGYDITIHWRMTAEQFLGRKKEASA